MNQVSRTPVEHYRNRRTEASAEAEAAEARLGRLSTLRLWAFLLAIGPFLLLETSPRSLWPILLGVGALALVGFVILLVKHRRARTTLERARMAVRLQNEAGARLRRDWDRIPCPSLGPIPSGHPWGDDLNATGQGSLAHLLGTVTTAPGRAALRDALLFPGARQPTNPAAWLRALGATESGPAPAASGSPPGRADEPPAPPESGATSEAEGPRDSDTRSSDHRSARRQAVEELARHPGWREDLQMEGRLAGGEANPSALGLFLEWAEGPGWDGREGWTLPVARILAVANPVLLLAWLVGWMALPVWVIGLAGSLLLHRRFGAEASRRFDAAEAAQASLSRWSAILDLTARMPGESPLLESHRAMARAGGDEGSSPEALRRLRSLSDWAGVRRSGLTHFPLVALFCWDAHHLARIEAWRDAHGSRVHDWVRLVGEVELVSALATLRHDHPDWCFGTELQAPSGIEGEAVRHPLLPPAEAVANHVNVPGPGGLLLVTGSNMSGKSTLLRALGANQLLFLAGGPVAASHWATPPVHPWTAMRIKDSLTQGVSFFLAELQRLRAVVDGARSEPTLVLLDEILQGTNTAERRIAARIILEHLLEAGAIGAVSTHDLTLAREPALEPHLEQVHFREDVREVDGRRTLDFDHRLRPGPATSKNALLLLELVGLGVDSGSPAEDSFREPDA